MNHAVFYDSNKNFFIRALQDGETLGDDPIEATGHNLPSVLPIIKGMIPVDNPVAVLKILTRQFADRNVHQVRMLYQVERVQFVKTKTGAVVSTKRKP